MANRASVQKPTIINVGRGIKEQEKTHFVYSF